MIQKFGRAMLKTTNSFQVLGCFLATTVLSHSAHSATRLTGSIGGKSVDIIRADVLGGEIQTNKTTWLISHGWNSSRGAQNIQLLSSSLILSRPGDQVLTLDWSTIADSGIGAPCEAAAGILPVAIWSSGSLQQYGFRPEDLNLIGHSFGSYVVDEIAQRMPRKVRSLVALDPAANFCPSTFDPVSRNEIYFARDAVWSWAFHSSSFGNEYVPVRAHEAFIVESGLNTLSAHSMVVDLFAYLIYQQNDPLAAFFGLDDLLDGLFGPWVLDAYYSGFAGDDRVPGYEAVITDPDGVRPTRLTFLPSAPGLNVAVAPRANDSDLAVVSLIASDREHGDSGISKVTMNGVRLPGDSVSGTNSVGSQVVVWLQPGTNSIEVVATDGFFQPYSTTNRVSVVSTRSGNQRPPILDLERAEQGQEIVKVHVGGPLRGTAIVESSTNLKEWNEVMAATLMPTLETGTNANGVFSIHFGKATLNLPSGSGTSPSGFYRAHLR